MDENQIQQQEQNEKQKLPAWVGLAIGVLLGVALVSGFLAVCFNLSDTDSAPVVETIMATEPSTQPETEVTETTECTTAPVETSISETVETIPEDTTAPEAEETEPVETTVATSPLVDILPKPSEPSKPLVPIEPKPTEPLVPIEPKPSEPIEETECTEVSEPSETVDDTELTELTEPDETVETTKATETEESSEPTSAPETEETTPTINRNDVELLACVIYQEAGADYICDTCRRRVADVVLNRVMSPLYPNTIYGVLTQYCQYGRFYWTGVVWPASASYAGNAHAVARAYRIAEEVLSGQHSDLYGGGWIGQAEFPSGSEQIYHCGIYFGR